MHKDPLDEYDKGVKDGIRMGLGRGAAMVLAIAAFAILIGALLWA